MKVLWLSHLVPYPPKGGALQRSYNLLRETARYHEVSLLAFNQRRLLRATMGDGKEALGAAREALEAFCKRVEVLPIPCEATRWGRPWLMAWSYLTPDPYTVNWLKSAPMAAAVSSFLARDGFGAVHFDTISLAVYRHLVNGPRTVLTHHNVESHMMARRADQERGPLKRRYLRREAVRLAAYERRMCPRFDVNVTCSKLDAERLADVVPGVRAVEVPNGVDLDYFRPAGAVEVPNRLVFAGRLNAYANREAVLYIVRELWPRLRPRLPEVTVDIVGAGPPAEALALARAEPGFRVHGFVDDVRPYLDRAAVYLCPIRDGGGTKLKVLDALAMRKAIVAHPVACEGIEVRDGVSVRLASDPEAFVEGVSELVADAELRHAMGAEGRRLVEARYGYATIGRRLADVLGGAP